MSAPTTLQGLSNALALLKRVIVGTPEAARERDQAIHVVNQLIKRHVSGAEQEKQRACDLTADLLTRVSARNTGDSVGSNANDLKAELISAIECDSDRFGGKAQLAQELGISASFLYLLLAGRKSIPERIANRYGFTKVKTYARLNSAKKGGAA